MKILNLYACLGGNRYKWDEVTDIEVTAVGIVRKSNVKQTELF